MGIKRDREQLAADMRAAGHTWPEIAGELRARWRDLNVRQAMRLAHRWSQEQVAQEWCDRWPDEPRTSRQVSYWEQWPEGGHQPPLETLARLADIYECDVADLLIDYGCYRHKDEMRQADRVISTSQVVPGILRSPVGQPYSQTVVPSWVEEVIEMDRRRLLAAALGGLAGTALLGRTPVMAVPSAGPDLADYFRSQLFDHYKTDVSLGAQLLIDPVASQYRLIRNAADSARSEAIRTDLLGVAVAYGGFVGWLHQDLRELDTASSWINEALALAHQTRDPNLIAYALCYLGAIRIELEDGAGAVDLTTAAIGQKGITPKTRMHVLRDVARAQALRGDRDACDRAIDQGNELLDSEGDDGYPWGTAWRATPGFTDVLRASCYTKMGLATEAAGLWETVIGLQPDASRRDRGVFLSRQAIALLGVEGPSAAVDPAAKATECLRTTGSARMRTELATLQGQAFALAPCSGRDELVDVLSA